MGPDRICAEAWVGAGAVFAGFSEVLVRRVAVGGSAGLEGFPSGVEEGVPGPVPR